MSVQQHFILVALAKSAGACWNISCCIGDAVKIDSWPVFFLALLGCLAIAIAENLLGNVIAWLVISGVLLLLALAVLFGVIVFEAIWTSLVDPVGASRRLGIFESDWGREAGWFVELDGQPMPPVQYIGDFLANANLSINLRVPRSVYESLLAEASAEGVSLEQLCLSKLVAQLRDVV